MYEPGTEITVGTLLVGPEVQMGDLTSTDILGMISSLSWPPPPFADSSLKPRTMRMRFVYITEDGAGPFPLTSGASITITHSVANAPKLGILLVPGPPSYEPSERVNALLRNTVAGGGHVLAICSGILPVAASGVLDGKPATAPQAMLPMLRTRFPRVLWQDVRRWERGEPGSQGEGEVWSSGTILNGVDLVAEFMRGKFSADIVEAMIALAGVAERPAEYSDAEKSKLYLEE